MGKYVRISIACLCFFAACWRLYALKFPAPQPNDFLETLKLQHVRNIEQHRRALLVRFFDRYNGSKPYPIAVYMAVSREHKLDYRLLPAISVAESTAGQHACGNNWFGWANCKGSNFRSVEQGIRYIAEQLDRGDYYRGKTLEQQLRVYNPRAAYSARVLELIQEIQP